MMIKITMTVNSAKKTNDCTKVEKQMKNKFKILLRWAAIFVACFLIIYLFVFFSGWKLFESGDPILIEIGASLVLSFFVAAFTEALIILEKRIAALEEHIKKLEDRNK